MLSRIKWLAAARPAYKLIGRHKRRDDASLGGGAWDAGAILALPRVR